MNVSSLSRRRHRFDGPSAAPAAPDELAVDVRVRMARASVATKPARILLLHGLAGSARIWRRLLERARPEWEIWEAELPWGSARSEWGADRDVAEPARRAIELVGGNVDVVVAHSFAANCLLEALDGDGNRAGGAADLRLRGIVLVSPFYRHRGTDFDWPTINYYLNDFDSILEEGIRVEARRPLDPDVQRAMALRVRDCVGPYGWVRFFDTYLRTPQLRMARMPRCLVVAGERDVAAFPSDAEALAAALPDGRLHVLTGCGHFAMVERPAELAALIDHFVEEVSLCATPTRETHA